ncbi:N/A [soil metagenome]
MRLSLLGLLLVACSSSSSGGSPDAAAPDDTGDAAAADVAQSPTITTVFVIPLENKSSSQIYGDTTDAPYINNTLLARGAHATMFTDELPTLPSEPHYVWMEAGTNSFSDRTFTGDGDPSAANSTASTDHLVTQLEAAGVPWMAYQEGITSGSCPIKTSGNYAAKHDPFVFFKDVVGSPPSASAARCAAHHKSYADFPADLAAGLSGYVFITPNLCHEMHGGFTCPSLFDTKANIKAGDDWLAAELPRLLDYTDAHSDALILLVWDEGDTNNVMPFIALGGGARAGYTSSIAYTHGAFLASLQHWFGVPRLTADAADPTLVDMFD